MGYGQGSLDRSYQIARSYLDFYAFTPHAQHADGNAPKGYPIVNENWEAIQDAARSYDDPGTFRTFLAYEWHSSAWGHVHVVYEEDGRPLHFAPSLADLQDIHRSERSILVPHHIAYNRGADWDQFDPDCSPIVEIFSEHGSSERDGGLHPMLGHSGGPGSVAYTAQHGLSIGRRFGFTAGTDNPDGYPGGYGLGLTGAWTRENTRTAVMEAIRSRRTYGVTGDRIEVTFTANDQPMGSCVDPGDVEASFDVLGWDEIALIELIRDGRTVRAWTPPVSADQQGDDVYRFRLEYGWGPMKGYHIYEWTGAIQVEGGMLTKAVPCFASDPFDEHRRKRIDSVEADRCVWRSHTSRGGIFTTRNSNTVGSANDAVCLEVEGDLDTRIEIEIGCHAGNRILATSADFSVANHNGMVSKSVTIGELVDGRVAIRMGKPSSWIVAHRAHTRAQLTVSERFVLEDCKPGSYAYLRVTQANGQMSWSSPVFFGLENVSGTPT